MIVKNEIANNIPDNISIISFNDSEGRTKEEILAVIDKSVESYRKKNKSFWKRLFKRG